MTILSSRQHSCIHPKISKSSRKNELCRDLVKGKTSTKKENSEVPLATKIRRNQSKFINSNFKDRRRIRVYLFE